MSTKSTRALKSGGAASATVNTVRGAAKSTPRKAAAESATAASASTPNNTYDTLIVGAGFGGLGSAIKLKEAGLSNFVVLERAADVGGTWRDNQYPGAACDIPSNLYSFSFAPNPNWGSSYSGAKEIMGYIHHLVEEFGLSRFIKFNQNVADVRLNDEEGIWYVTTSEGVIWKGRTIVMASGALANASFPKIPGVLSGITIMT
jgi:cation diffusion facilitator CzcD-associated flavoprotein CzcO